MVLSRTFFTAAVVILGTGLSAAAAQAQTSIADSYQGWYTSSSHYASNTNTYTGNGGTYRSFYTFSLANAVAASALSISFAAGNGNKASNTAETLNLYDFTGDTSALIADESGTTANTIFNDLGSGTLYGTTSVTGASGAMPLITIALSQGAIDQYNAAVAGGAQYFTVGASLATSGVLWSGSGTTPAATLSVSAVPEPASWAMMIGGFGMIGAAMRRQRRSLATA